MGFEDDWMYFKAGNYNQNNSGDPGDYCQVSFFSLNVTHSSSNNEAPSTSITSPSNNDTFIEGDNITITADAADSDGSIDKVEFFQGNTKLGEDTSAPYSFEWTNAPVGNYVLTTRAIDNENGTSSSEAISISVEPVYSAPHDIPKFQGFIGGSKLQAPTSSTIATQAELISGYSDEFFYVFENNKIAFNQTGASMRTELRHEENWVVSDGDRSFCAKIDVVLQTCDQVTVVQIHDDANAGNGPNKPLLRIYKHQTKSPANHLWAAIKTDDGGVNTKHVDLGEDPGGYFDCEVKIVDERMIIEIDGVEEANEDISFWTFPSYWKAGVYLQDAGEATAHFDKLFEIIQENTTPTVGITAPETQDSFEAGDNITIRANASDIDGTITKVEFYEGDNKLGEDLTSPYSFIWRNVPGGEFELTAVAVDDKEGVTTSEIVSVQISGSLETPLSSVLLKNNKPSVYPNPFTNKINIEYLADPGTPAFITIHDITGKKVDEFSYEGSNSNNHNY